MVQNTTPEPITNEILPSERLGAYMAFTYNTPGILPDDPSWTWQQLRWNPWKTTRAPDGTARALRGLRLGLRILRSFAVLRDSAASQLRRSGGSG